MKEWGCGNRRNIEDFDIIVDSLWVTFVECAAMVKSGFLGTSLLNPEIVIDFLFWLQ
jgi:hypothetical protein